MKRRRFSMDSCSLTSLFASPSLYKDRLRTTADRPFNPIPPNFPAREIPNPNSIPIVFPSPAQFNEFYRQCPPPSLSRLLKSSHAGTADRMLFVIGQISI
jgi:hypothetical protein